MKYLGPIVEARLLARNRQDGRDKPVRQPVKTALVLLMWGRD